MSAIEICNAVSARPAQLWQAWCAAAGAFGGYVPEALAAHRAPEALTEDALVAHALSALPEAMRVARERARDSDGNDGILPAGVRVDMDPGALVLTYGSGRTIAILTICPGGRSSVRAQVRTELDVVDIESAEESLHTRQRAARAVLGWS